MEISFAGLVGVPGIYEGCQDCKHVGGHCEEEGIDVPVSERCDYGWEEIGDRACSDEAEEEDHLRLSVDVTGMYIEHVPGSTS